MVNKFGVYQAPSPTPFIPTLLLTLLPILLYKPIICNSIPTDGVASQAAALVSDIITEVSNA